MKNTLMLAAVTAFIGTSAMALDLENDTSFTTTVNSGVLEFSVDATTDGITDIETGATVFVNVTENGTNYTFVSLGYDLVSDEITVGAEYNAFTNLNDVTVLYGAVAVDYVTSETDLADGDVYVTPTVGVSHALSDTLAVYAEVDYTFDATNDFDRAGGTVEVGVPYELTNSVAIIPSVSRSFDTDATTANVEVAFTF